MVSLEHYFEKFRISIIGNEFEHFFESGKKKIIYADWAASGRLYRPIEDFLINKLGPYVANTHTETTLTGTVMTDAYQQAFKIIKQHVNASEDDKLFFAGFGMTAVINKFQRILGLRVPEKYRKLVSPSDNEKPLVIITHMEHHSNQTTWVECLCDVEIIRRNEDGLPNLNHLEEILKANKNREMIIGSFTACSNVTGIISPFYQMAEIVHKYNGYCFIDFSASAPYVEIDMHPNNEKQQFDAVFFSPHKFLGGPGSSGVVVFNKNLYQSSVPDQPGGGTVAWTNPWGEHRFFDDIETREDGGTPGFLQGIKASLAVLLKEDMGIDKMAEREDELKNRLIDGLSKIPSLSILDVELQHRLGYVSYFMEGVHHSLIVRLLNDRFGIQTRGGCSCAGTYGHVLLNIDYHESQRITHLIDGGDLSVKPGWVRVSLHPIMTDKEVDYIIHAIEEVVKNHQKWENDYKFNSQTGDFELQKSCQFKIDIRSTYRST